MQNNRVAGSFRDPDGYVISRNDRIFRAINASFEALWKEIESSGLAEKLIKNGLIVRTTRVTDEKILAELRAENPGFNAFLEHEKLGNISYPYEWCVSMLADAGIHTLKVQYALLKAGFSLKDATAYNIQFVQGKPVFIDITSIERPKRLDVWFALGQFNRMFTFPLLLTRYRGWDLRSYFVTNLDGRTVQQMGDSFQGLARWRPSLLLDVTLPLMIENRAGQKKDFKWEEAGQARNTKADAHFQTLERLSKKLEKLSAGYRTKGVWSDYTQTCTYDSDAEAAKKRLVTEYLKIAQSKLVLDVGCNTGDYSFLSAQTGASVISVDGDHDAIENLYHRLKQKPQALTPLVINLGNPSPGIGYLNRERPAFLERFRADTVLSLALIHHLLVSANLSLESIREMFYAMTEKHLVLEFVPTDDPMFQKLIQFRVNLFADLTLQSCIKAFSEKFDLVEQRPIPGSPRTLLLLRKK